MIADTMRSTCGCIASIAVGVTARCACTISRAWSLWKGPGQHLIECHPQRIHIRAGIDLLVYTPGLLRGHIRQGPFESMQVAYLLRFPRELGGSAEIDEFRRQCFGVNRDIAGIDVFMHDADTLHGLQSPSQLYGNMKKGSQFKPVLRNKVHQGDGIEVFCNEKRTVRGILKGMV